MEQSTLTAIFLPLALGIIMLGMGMTLNVSDFRRVVLYPKAAIIGLSSQIVILPLLGFGLAAVFFESPELAVGFILIALCPGGATSNLISHLAKADLALSISLTAISSLITNFSIPILLNVALFHYMGGDQAVQLPLFKTFVQIFVITILPVSIGMLIKRKYPAFALRSQKAMNIISLFFFILILLAAILKERENIIPYFKQAGLATLLLNVLSLLIGYYLGKMFSLNKRQSSAIAIETGIQNGTLAIALALSPVILNNTQMAVPGAIYSLLMFVTAAVVILSSRNGNAAESRKELQLS
ncbi:bile acid:sodium symporter family protein [Marivirga sp. S37H4]|uniref:Bile acid:sodium symporter family protein n=1 Tax=Marivirga aurantiaca TaxID=2802615 RepID=A0A934X1L3_9BACT|nr:bile acid:sodium symporter family protein [Marivirga aurantiaca]MBK6266782.1 bile acid:sodium symporter family protein [Marivirga aurantiaca]